MAKRASNQSRGELHARILDELEADHPYVSRGGFWRAMRKLPDAEYFHWLLADGYWLGGGRFVPDAHYIDVPKRNVVIYEAVATHDISEIKFGRMVDMAWALDEDYWNLILVRCDRFGRTVYSPQEASLVAALEHRDVPGSYRVPDWPRYSVEYTAAVFERQAA
jgi:hypothetical protein